MEPSGNSVLVQASMLAGAGGVVGGRAGHASPESRCAPLPPGASGPPSLQTLACVCTVLRPTSSFSPTCSVASGTLPPPPALQSSFCHPDAFLTNSPGSRLSPPPALSCHVTASLPLARPPRGLCAAILCPHTCLLRATRRVSPSKPRPASCFASLLVPPTAVLTLRPFTWTGRTPTAAALSRHVLTVFSETLPASLGALHAGPTLLFTDVGIALRPPPPSRPRPSQLCTRSP